VAGECPKLFSLIRRILDLYRNTLRGAQDVGDAAVCCRESCLSHLFPLVSAS